VPIASPHDLSRFLDLDAGRRRLIVEAVLTLTATSLAVTFLPFRNAIRFGSVELGKVGASARDVAWAVEAAARRLPWRIVCLQKGLAAQRMVRRNGHEAHLHYGLRKAEAEGELQAHVWVTVDGQPFIGGAEARDFAPVAVYS
jgi:hypothetical protein